MNRKKSHEGIPGEYGSWSRTLVSFFEKTLAEQYEKIELFRNQTCGGEFHAQNISQNVMNGLKRYVQYF